MTKTIQMKAIKTAQTTERERLAAELSDYRTEAERNDLNALLDEYSDEETAQIRELLNRPTVAA